MLIRNLQMALLLVYKSLLAALHALVNSAALIKCGRPLIPAFEMAITNGDEAAVPSERLSEGLLEGTSSPMMNVPRT